MRGNLMICAATILGVVAPAVASAQGGGVRLIDSVAECRKVTEPGARLACYDRTVAALDGARASDGLVIMDREEVREKRRSLFGLRLPDINLFGRNDTKEAEVVAIDSTVTRVTATGRDRLLIRLADKSVWRTTEPARFDPVTGDKVHIERAALGSFRGSFAGRKGIKMERIE